jgi:sugar phosphate isomerase/epimerase
MHAAEVLGAKTIRIDAGGQGESFTNEQFDLVVSRFREFAQRAYDNGYKFGPAHHWGPEVVPANMVRICQAADHPGFGVLLHFRGNTGDALIAPWAMHTHISWDISEHSLPASLGLLRARDYSGAYSVEHHSGANEYAEVAVQLARVRAELATW